MTSQIMLIFALLLVVLKSQASLGDSLTEANNRFALETYHKLSSQDGNVFFSPLSLSLLLGMLYQGSDGNTRTQIGSVTNFDQVKNLTSSFRGLSTFIATPNENYTLLTANRMYARNNYDFLPSYLDSIRNDFKSDVIPSDYQNNAEAVREEINAWVEEKTMGKIQNFIPAKVLKPSTVMVLVNALYFKGDWESKFNANDTSSQPFLVSTKSIISTDMMWQNSSFRVMANEEKGYQVLEMPYKGDDVSMLVVLPHDIDGLARIEEVLTYEEMQTIHNTLKEREKNDVLLSFPKFMIEHKYTMNNYLSDMGMLDLFTPSVCDLSRMDGTRHIYISKVFHQSFLVVNEDGSEAAAASGAHGPGGIAPKPPVEFKADHPFIFYIRDNRSGSTLFMGRYVQP